MKKFAGKNRQAKEASGACIEKYGDGNRNKTGKVVNGQIRLAVFDLTGGRGSRTGTELSCAAALSEVLYKPARSLRKLERAEKLNAGHAERIKRETLKEACGAAGRGAGTHGLTERIIETIKNKIPGIRELSMSVKNIFISRPVKGRGAEAVKTEKERITADLKEVYGDINITGTYFCWCYRKYAEG